MAESKDMSDWIKFFTGAGIPPGPASTYAVTFIDNRIKRSMLIDLSKEYLKDMGISVMGDIISILKHGKSVHAREEREKPALSALPATPDGKVEIKRQTTPGSRMLEHYLRKEGIDMDPEPKVKVTTEMAARLGAVPKTGSKSTLNVSQIKHVEVKPVKKARKISPEPDSQQTASKESDAKKSVFARLGGGQSAGDNSSGNGAKQAVKRGTSDTPITVTGLSKDIDTSSVFKRLGGVKRQKTMSISSDDGSVLEYCGVLKPGGESTKPSHQKVTVILGGPKASPLQKRLGAKVGDSTPTSQQTATKLSILDRLGPQRSGGITAQRLGAQKSEATSSTGTSVKITRTISNTEKLTNVQERLGPQKAEASSTSDVLSLKNVKKTKITAGINIKDRLGVKDSETSTVKKLAVKKSTGIVKRLGTQTKSTGASVAQRGTATKKTGLIVQLTKSQSFKVEKNPGAVLGRLGLPITHSETSTVTTILTKPKLKSLGVKNRLGTQKAEVTSTTPATTTIVKKSAGKKIVRKAAHPSDEVCSVTIAAHVGSLRQASTSKASSSSGVFSRLGAKSS